MMVFKVTNRCIVTLLHSKYQSATLVKPVTYFPAVAAQWAAVYLYTTAPPSHMLSTFQSWIFIWQSQGWFIDTFLCLLEFSACSCTAEETSVGKMSCCVLICAEYDVIRSNSPANLFLPSGKDQGQNKHKGHEQSGDGCGGVTEDSTNETKCDQHMETFIKCIKASGM